MPGRDADPRGSHGPAVPTSCIESDRIYKMNKIKKKTIMFPTIHWNALAAL